jgi:hypothetical protein
MHNHYFCVVSLNGEMKCAALLSFLQDSLFDYHHVLHSYDAPNPILANNIYDTAQK